MITDLQISVGAHSWKCGRVASLIDHLVFASALLIKILFDGQSGRSEGADR